MWPRAIGDVDLASAIVAMRYETKTVADRKSLRLG